MKWNELRKIAEQHGWRIARNGKKHYIYYHPDKNFIIEIGRHGKEEIKNGRFYKMKKKIGF